MAIGVAEGVGAATATRPRRRRPSAYPWWFYAPAAVIFSVLFVVPTLASFYFSLTRWTLFNATFIGFGNFVQFFHDPFLVGGLVHTLIYAVLTSGAKVVLGLLLAVLLSAGAGEPRSRLLHVGDLFDDRWRLTGLTLTEATLADGTSVARVPLFGESAAAGTAGVAAQ